MNDIAQVSIEKSYSKEGSSDMLVPRYRLDLLTTRGEVFTVLKGQSLSCTSYVHSLLRQAIQKPSA